MIYLDLLFILNFIYDFLLLITTGLVLKRMFKLKNILVASFIGASSYFLFFLNFSSIVVLFYVVIVAIIMIVISFGKNNIITNMIYLYMNSIILGGFYYFLSIQLTYNRNGLLYYYKGDSVNVLLIIIIAPLVLIFYIKQNKLLREKQNLNYIVKISFKNGDNLTLNGFIDSGNRLKCPITNKYIIILANNIYEGTNPLYVPFTGVNNKGLLKCFSINYIEINKCKFFNYLVGISEGEINIEGSDCILNSKLLEDLNV